jgi:hypothetical protein
MERIMQGLQAIIQSNNPNEMKQIAQALLQEEQSEAEAEVPQEEAGFKEKAMEAMG